MSETYCHRRQNTDDPGPSTSRGFNHKHNQFQRSHRKKLSANGSRVDAKHSDSSNIENDDVNIPKHLKSKSSKSKRKHEKFSTKSREMKDSWDSDDEVNIPTTSKKKARVIVDSESDSDAPIRCKRKQHVFLSESDSGSDTVIKRKKNPKVKKPVLESDDSDGSDVIIPKFKSKKPRLIDHSDDDHEVPQGRSSSSNMNGNASHSLSRQLSDGDDQASGTLRRNRGVNRYFFNDEANRYSSEEDWSRLSDSESEWDTNWENDWEEHWQNVEANRSQANGDLNVLKPTVKEPSEKQSKTEEKSSKENEVKSTDKTGSNDEASKDSCPICLLDFTDQKLGTPAACDHVFCLDCLLEWCKVVNTCPADRKEFLSIHVRKHLGGEIVETLPVQDRTRAESSAEDSTSCEVCGRTDGEDTMLLCDGCDLGFHMDCLNPPLTEIPTDEWLCPDCSSGVIPGIGMNFLTLFSVFNEILGERGLLHGFAGPFDDDDDDDLVLGADFLEREAVEAGPRENEPRRPRRNALLDSEDERPARRPERRRRNSGHRNSEERQTRSTAQARRPSNASDAGPSTNPSGPRHRMRTPTPRVWSPRPNRQAGSRANMAAGDGQRHRQSPQNQRNQLSPQRISNARSLRRHTRTNFQNRRPRRASSETRTIRMVRRRWVDTSSSEE